MNKYVEFNFNTTPLLVINLFLFFPLIIKTTRIIILSNIQNNLSIFLWFYIFFHPILKMLLNVIDVRSLPHNYSISNFLTSNASILVQLIIIIMLMVSTVEREWYKYFNFLWYFSFLVGIEALIFFYLLSSLTLHYLVIDKHYYWFVSSVIQSKVFCGFLGFICVFLSLYYTKLYGKNPKYLLGIILGILTIIAAQERSIILTLLFFFFGILVCNFINLFRKNLFKGLFIIISSLLIFYSFSNRSH